MGRMERRMDEGEPSFEIAGGNAGAAQAEAPAEEETRSADTTGLARGRGWHWHHHGGEAALAREPRPTGGEEEGTRRGGAASLERWGHP